MNLFNTEIEQSMLGAMLLNKQSYFDAQMSVGDFFDPVHQDIFKAIAGRHANDLLVSPVVLEQIMSNHAGLSKLAGGKYLIRLAGSATGLNDVSSLANVLRDLKEKRDLESILLSSIKKLESQEATASDIIGGIEVSLADIAPQSTGGIISMMQATADAAEIAGEAHRSESISGVPTGIADLDHMTGGLQSGELVLLGGRPSMGKTAVALSIALATARAGLGVAISSLEMSPAALAMRAISNQTACNNSGVAYSDARRGVMSEDQARVFFTSTNDIGRLPIEILPETMRDIGSIYAGVKKAQRKLTGKGAPLRLIVVDYLQLISGQAKNRFELIAEISIALKGLAMKTGVPVLALSQLSRALESRDLHNRRPMLSDLRESGQLEQDADVVMFCYRHEYYLDREAPDENDLEATTALSEAKNDHKNKMEVIVSKQRMGDIGTVKIGCNMATNFLWDLQHYET